MGASRHSKRFLGADHRSGFSVVGNERAVVVGGAHSRAVQKVKSHELV